MSDSLTIDGVGPMPVERPQSVAELCAIVRRCADTKTAIYPVGGGTMLDYGMPPARPGIALSTTALNQIIDYPARDLTITVQAGITMQKLQATLATENQWLPIDIPPQATIGGAIACDVSGPRRYGYGTLRDYLIGITVVNDRGEECHAGGRVVKNVAGYDMMKLHTGALGTLGVITQVTLKVKPRPEVTAVVTGGCTSRNMTDAMDAIFQSQTRPTAIELLLGSGGSSEWQFELAYEGTSEAAAWQVERAVCELSAANLSPIHGLTPDESRLALMPNPLIENAAITLRVVLPRTALADFVRRLTKMPAGGCLRAHAGTGFVKIGYSDNPAMEFVEAMTPALLNSAVMYGGNLIVQRCRPEAKKSLSVWGHPPADLALQKAVKRALDPQNIFNPGRFVTDAFV